MQTVPSCGLIQKPCRILSLFKMEQGSKILCCGLTCQNSVSFWKSLILRPPGWRRLEPSGFSSVVSSQCLWCNHECILPRKLWVFCKSMVEFWSKLLDRRKINVKCWERQWLGAVLQISCCSTDMLFSSFQPWVQPPIPVAFSPYTLLPRAHLHTVDMEPLLHLAAIMRSLKPSSATLRSHACLLSHICILVSWPIMTVNPRQEAFLCTCLWFITFHVHVCYIWSRPVYQMHLLHSDPQCCCNNVISIPSRLLVCCLTGVLNPSIQDTWLSYGWANMLQ